MLEDFGTDPLEKIKCFRCGKIIAKKCADYEEIFDESGKLIRIEYYCQECYYYVYKAKYSVKVC
jgi:hypothetical protein